MDEYIKGLTGTLSRIFCGRLPFFLLFEVDFLEDVRGDITSSTGRLSSLSASISFLSTY